MARTRLEPGQHTIDSVKPQRKDGTVFIRWSGRLPDGTLHRARTQATTVGEARRRAKATWVDILSSVGSGGQWRGSDDMSAYIAEVSIPAIEGAGLAPRTVYRYLEVASLLRAEFAGRSIADATTFRALETALQTIGRERGRGTATQAKSVLSRYVVQQLVRDGVLSANPMAGVQITLPEAEEPRYKDRRPTARALTAEEYMRVLTWLLALDPADGVTAPKRGMYTLADRVAVRRAAVDVTIMQMTTGMRITEARQSTWDDVEIGGTADAPTLHITISAERAKTRRGRRVQILHDGATAHLIARRQTVGGRYIIGSPAKPDTEWDRDNAQKAIAALYKEIAAACDVPLLEKARSHVWRTTLNDLTSSTLSPAIRAAHFGHTEAENARSYTDVTRTDAMKAALESTLLSTPNDRDAEGTHRDAKG